MKVSLLEPLGIPEERVRELARPIEEAGHEFVYYPEKTTDASELARRSAGADVVMIANNPYPAEVVHGADALKMIAVAFTGIDHVGLDAARERGVTVCNCAGYSDVSVAELAVGLVIDVLRHVVPADAATRAGGTSAGLMGREICGKTVGIVGTGHIGCATARLFGAFGARVLGYARHESEAAREAGIEFASLDELLAESDIVSLHLPLTPETRGFFDAEKIARMKDGAVLVNCARGPIVDNDALAAALNEGKLAGAGVDVFDMEPPLPEGYALASAKNCVLTPHVAFFTEEAMERRAVIEFDNVLVWLEGAPKNVCALLGSGPPARGVLPAVALVCEDGERGIGVALGKSLVEGVGEVAEVVLVKSVAACVPEGERAAALLRVSTVSCNKSETIGERHQMGSQRSLEVSW